MQMTESEYRQLKAQIDADAATELEAVTERIEGERVQNHQALDRVWAMMQKKAKAADSQTALFAPVVANGNNGHGGSERTAPPPFPMQAMIVNFIKMFDVEKVTMPVVYEYLWDRFRPKIEHRDQNHVKGQITNILSKLTEGDDPLLEVTSERIGNLKVFKPRV